MNPPSGMPVTAGQAELYGEAERLTQELCARMRAGDDDADEELVRRREEVLRAIREMSGPSDRPPHAAGELVRYSRESAGAIQRMIDLNGELVTLLEDRKVDVRRQLAEISRCRQSLASYRGPAPLSPAFVDRLG